VAKKEAVGTGRKQCPVCDEIVAARSRECPKCQHKFVGRKKKRRKKAVEAAAPQTPEVDVATVVKAHDLIQRCGGIGKAKGMLDTVARAAKQ
jgi:hypothetical protein